MGFHARSAGVALLGAATAVPGRTNAASTHLLIYVLRPFLALCLTRRMRLIEPRKPLTPAWCRCRSLMRHGCRWCLALRLFASDFAARPGEIIGAAGGLRAERSGTARADPR